MVGRNKQVKSLKMKLNDLIYNKTNDLVLVRGIMGSGKSLFIRYCLTEIVEYHKDLRPDKYSIIITDNHIRNSLFLFSLQKIYMIL